MRSTSIAFIASLVMTVPIEVVELPTGHFVHREAEADVTARVLAFLAQ
jgi:hypothetical protein